MNNAWNNIGVTESYIFLILNDDIDSVTTTDETNNWIDWIIIQISLVFCNKIVICFIFDPILKLVFQF